jgi:hypothetical protein
LIKVALIFTRPNTRLCHAEGKIEIIMVLQRYSREKVTKLVDYIDFSFGEYRIPVGKIFKKGRLYFLTEVA